MSIGPSNKTINAVIIAEAIIIATAVGANLTIRDEATRKKVNNVMIPLMVVGAFVCVALVEAKKKQVADHCFTESDQCSQAAGQALVEVLKKIIPLATAALTGDVMMVALASANAIKG